MKWKHWALTEPIFPLWDDAFKRRGGAHIVKSSDFQLICRIWENESDLGMSSADPLPRRLSWCFTNAHVVAIMQGFDRKLTNEPFTTRKHQIRLRKRHIAPVIYLPSYRKDPTAASFCSINLFRVDNDRRCRQRWDNGTKWVFVNYN